MNSYYDKKFVACDSFKYSKAIGSVTCTHVRTYILTVLVQVPNIQSKKK